MAVGRMGGERQEAARDWDSVLVREPAAESEGRKRVASGSSG